MASPQSIFCSGTAQSKRNTSMIIWSRKTILAAAVLSVGVATQLGETDARHKLGREVLGLQSCGQQLANCMPIVLAAAKEDD
jgi:hypothetical protein